MAKTELMAYAIARTYINKSKYYGKEKADAWIFKHCDGDADWLNRVATAINKITDQKVYGKPIKGKESDD